MPFGTRLDSQGALFRLWAPVAKSVRLQLPEERRDFVMPRNDAGWYELRMPNLRTGTVYQYVIDESHAVPDPASRHQPSDIDGPSELIDPAAFEWPDAAWTGRPWCEAVLYELHVGTFTHQGTFAAAESHLERLASLGITAIELMPLADFAGKRNWGYDGVLPFAPSSRYGDPTALKQFIAAAHHHGLMVLIDVVYNHFGPQGNYLGLYAPQFFAQTETDWGHAINFSERFVRDFFIENALYWFMEFNVDGLRIDAVHAIRDNNRPDFLEELAARVRLAITPGRHVHLVIENDNNQSRYLRRDANGDASYCDAQWNDDFHHAMHVILTGETAGYYADYAQEPVVKLGRALAEGFIYQGERSLYRGVPRGETSVDLPPLAFVNFLQNHDQIGNRAFGERLTELVRPAPLAAATVILLLAPTPPMLFMGEEWGATTPFLFFCDFAGALGEAVRDGRRREFARFPTFSSSDARGCIPDPLALETFERSQLVRPRPAECLPINDIIRRLLDIRRREIVPRLAGMTGGARYAADGTYLMVEWILGDGSRLSLAANLGDKAATGRREASSDSRLLWGPEGLGAPLPAWTVVWTLAESAR